MEKIILSSLVKDVIPLTFLLFLCYLVIAHFSERFQSWSIYIRFKSLFAKFAIYLSYFLKLCAAIFILLSFLKIYFLFLATTIGLSGHFLYLWGKKLGDPIKNLRNFAVSLQFSLILLVFIGFIEW